MTPEAFMAGEARLSFRWGSVDCVRTLERWVAHVSGRWIVRGTEQDYDDEREGRALVTRLAMPVRLGRALRRAGFVMTQEPRVGDVGIIADGQSLAAAIRGGSQWLYRGEEGIGAAPLDVRVLGAWRVR